MKNAPHQIPKNGFPTYCSLKRQTSVPQIIHQIDEIIRDVYTPRGAKIERLKSLAVTCWDEVVPEHGTERFKNLKSAELQKRWSTVRDEVEKYDTKDRILYVLDWPASSGNFYWVK